MTVTPAQSRGRKAEMRRHVFQDRTKAFVSPPPGFDHTKLYEAIVGEKKYYTWALNQDQAKSILFDVGLSGGNGTVLKTVPQSELLAFMRKQLAASNGKTNGNGNGGGHASNESDEA